MSISAALKNLWWATVITLSFLFALVLVRLFHWPPDVGQGLEVQPGGFLKFLGILMVGYLMFGIWYYLLKPIFVVFLGEHRTTEPKACSLALIRYALPSAGIVVAPMAVVMALELPDPFEIAPAALLFAAIWYVGRNAGNAVQQIQTEAFGRP